MIGKIFKYASSLIRVLILKLLLGKKLKLNLKSIKSIYIGKGVRIRVKKGRQLVLGNNVYIDDYCRFECIEGNIYIGDNTFFNSNNNIVSLKKIKIGNNCLFGPNVGVFDHNHRYNQSNIPILNQGYIVDEININNNIWIGSNSIITKGVTVASDVVIGANSVVNKSIYNTGVYAGIPIKIIKSGL